jgi:hypothetical protein
MPSRLNDDCPAAGEHDGVKSRGRQIEPRGGGWIIETTSPIRFDVWETRGESGCHHRGFLNPKPGKGSIRHRQRHDYLILPGGFSELPSS